MYLKLVSFFVLQIKKFSSNTLQVTTLPFDDILLHFLFHIVIKNVPFESINLTSHPTRFSARQIHFAYSYFVTCAFWPGFENTNWTNGATIHRNYILSVSATLSVFPRKIFDSSAAGLNRPTQAPLRWTESSV